MDTDLPAEPDGDESDGRQASHVVDIFVSYRVRPDEELAGELKALLESAIDPAPVVFVSGLGGLRASAEGFREQIRRAAMSARAYVGLISSASVDREWIFFEAGAAFGRRALYVPILVDIDPGKLPSALGGYQGVRANDQMRLMEVVGDIAKELGSSLKTHFGQRYSRFSRVLGRYGKEPKESDLLRIESAIVLAKAGRLEESAEIFDALHASESDAEGKASVQIAKSLFLDKKDEDSPLALLEEQAEEIKSTATYKYWLGVFETNPIRAVRLLREAWDAGVAARLTRPCLKELCQKEFEVGHASVAKSRLRRVLPNENRGMRAVAFSLLAGHVGEQLQFERLLFYIAATIDESTSNLRSAAEYCWEQGFVAIGLHFANFLLDKKKTGSFALVRGLARARAELHSLAFQDYRTASEDGISVGTSNMASMLGNQAVPEAGLELMRRHEGTFDSADPGHPYETRARLERLVAEEEKKEIAYMEYGRKIVVVIHRLVESAIRYDDSIPYLLHQSMSAQSQAGLFSLVLSSGVPDARLNSEALEVVRVKNLPGMYALRGPARDVLCIVFIGQTVVEAVSVSGLKAREGDVEWLDFQHEIGEPITSAEEQAGETLTLNKSESSQPSN